MTQETAIEPRGFMRVSAQNQSLSVPNSSTVLITIPTAAVAKLSFEVGNTVQALAAFSIETQVHINGTWRSIASSAGDFSSPTGRLSNVSGAPVTLAAGAKAYFDLDTTGLVGVRLKATGGNATPSVVSIYASGSGGAGGSTAVTASPTFTGTAHFASADFSSLTAGRVVYSGTAGLLTDSAKLLYDDTTTMFKVGTTGANAGVQMGQVSSGLGAIWDSTVTPAGNNSMILGGSGLVVLGGAAQSTYIDGAMTYFRNASSATIMAISGTAGLGPAITAGTAASAVSALSVTQTRNYSGAATTYLDYNFTLTSTHASDLIYSYRDGATVYSSLTKGGALNAVSYKVGGVAGVDGTGTVITAITVVKGIVTSIAVS